MNTTTKKIIDQLKEQCELYKQFIIQHHGQQTIDRLNLELAIQKTNKMLEIRDANEFERIRKQLKTIIIFLSIFILSSCRTQYVAIPEYHTIEVNKHDTLIVRDSIMEKDSIYIHQKNDTVWKERYSIIYKDKWRDKIVYRDSIKIDSINVPYPVPRELTFMQRTWIKIGKTLSGLSILGILIGILVFIVKRRI